MPVLFFILLGVICVAGGVILKKKDDDSLPGKFSIAVAFFSFVVAGIMGIIALISYPCSLDRVNKMQNFYERNQTIFKEAVEKYPDATTVKTNNGTVETVKLSWDYTQEVLSYNEYLKWYLQYQDHWFYSLFVTNIPKGLDFIDLK